MTYKKAQSHELHDWVVEKQEKQNRENDTWTK